MWESSKQDDSQLSGLGNRVCGDVISRDRKQEKWIWGKGGVFSFGLLRLRYLCGICGGISREYLAVGIWISGECLGVDLGIVCLKGRA